MPKYNHAFSVGFSLENELEEGHKTPMHELLAGMARRLASLIESNQQELEAFDCFDTFEVEEKTDEN